MLNLKFSRINGIYYTNTKGLPFILKVTISSKSQKDIKLKIKKTFPSLEKEVKAEKIAYVKEIDKYYIVFRKVIYPNEMYCIECNNTCNIENWKE